MKKMIKRLSMASLLAASVTSTLATAAIQLPTVITLYNSEATLEGGGSTIAVLRQEPRRAELFSCSKRYIGSLKDFEAVETFFNEGLSTVNHRTNCISYSALSEKNFLVNKNAINSNDGKAMRYVFTGAGANVGLAEILSDVTTFTVDVNDGLGISQKDITLVGSRVYHSKLDNPTISTYRDSYKLSGMAQIQFSEIGK
jgi:hypothetical protein